VNFTDTYLFDSCRLYVHGCAVYLLVKNWLFLCISILVLATCGPESMIMVMFLLHYAVYENPMKATVLRELIVYVNHYKALVVGTSWLKFHAELVS
jgi:hypothetical protein